MLLQDKLQAIAAATKKRVPEDVREILARSVRELVQSGQARDALGAGERAPSFALQDADRQLHYAGTLLARGPLVISFNRGRWCQFCNAELQALQAVEHEIRSRGASLVSISPQDATNSDKSRRTNKLTFPLFVDRGGEVAQAFGLRWSVGRETQKAMCQIGYDLDRFNGPTGWVLPIPARYVVGQDGIVTYAELNPDHTRRPEPDDIFATLDKLARQKSQQAD
jgi:peroxiredoxin